MHPSDSGAWRLRFAIVVPVLIWFNDLGSPEQAFPDRD